MSNYEKWADGNEPDAPVACCLLISRNKDNADVPGFRERRRSWLAPFAGVDGMLRDRLGRFAYDGVPGELCRAYRSVNPRDPVVVKAKLAQLLTGDVIRDHLTRRPRTVDVTRIDAAACGLAAEPDCAMGRRWLIDDDTPHVSDADDEARFTAIAGACGVGRDELAVTSTPHGHAVVVPHGFDTRALLREYPDLTVKRDDLILVAWEVSL